MSYEISSDQQIRTRFGKHHIALVITELPMSLCVCVPALQYVATMTEDAAALRIQTVWRGFAARRSVKRMREEEMIFIGMVRTSVLELASGEGGEWKI